MFTDTFLYCCPLGKNNCVDCVYLERMLYTNKVQKINHLLGNYLQLVYLDIPIL